MTITPKTDRLYEASATMTDHAVEKAALYLCQELETELEELKALTNEKTPCQNCKCENNLEPTKGETLGKVDFSTVGTV